MERQYHLKFGGSAAAAVDAYAEYKRIVGDDDGGVMFTPDQYENYKKKVSKARLENRLFVSWTSPFGMDCKLVGPETPCFCEHRYKQHKSDYDEIPSERPIPIPCKVKGCGCRTYHYAPSNGSQPARCGCKHFPEDHANRPPYKCKSAKCQCAGFRTSWTCGCGEPAHAHMMLVETAEEREARGCPVGRPTMYQAMGGITGFSSLLDGYLRLDPSGRGAPPLEFLEQPITASDHPFLRANVSSIRAHKQAIGAPHHVVEADLAERMSAMKKPGESDMDFYERRYQERQKLEREAKRAAVRRPPPQAAVAAPSTSQKAIVGASGVQGSKLKPKSKPNQSK